MRCNKKLLVAIVAFGTVTSGRAALAQYYPQQQAYYPQQQAYYPQQQAYHNYTYPRFPVFQTPTQITGVTPGGGINTGGTTVFNSALDPFRQMSRNNGTMRNVAEPVFGPNGQITGFRTGQQWQNSITGQTHFQGNVFTPNGLGGGLNQQQVHYSPGVR